MLLARAGSFAAPNSRSTTARMIRRCGHPNALPNMVSPLVGLAPVYRAARRPIRMRDCAAARNRGGRLPLGVLSEARLGPFDGRQPGGIRLFDDDRSPAASGEALQSLFVRDPQDRRRAVPALLDHRVVEVLAEQRGEVG